MTTTVGFLFKHSSVGNGWQLGKGGDFTTNVHTKHLTDTIAITLLAIDIFQRPNCTVFCCPFF